MTHSILFLNKWDWNAICGPFITLLIQIILLTANYHYPECTTASIWWAFIMLTNNQFQDFKKILDDRFFELREEIRLELLESDNQHYIDLAGQVHDIGDESVADLLVDLQLASVDRHIEEIRDIDAALMRIAAGNYGACIDCGVSIEVDRLKAYPTAKRCQPCQAAYENLHLGGETPSL